MKETWWNHNTDKMLLLLVLLLSAGMVFIIAWKFPADMQLITWATGTFTAVLGAFLLIMTGRGARADGQTASGTPPTPPAAPEVKVDG